jgi:hypothetical protein
MTMESLRIPEPLLEFGHGQRMEAPKDGLFLFGPLEGTEGRSQVRIGVVGTDSGAGLSRRWLERIGVHIPGKTNRQGHPTTWAPDWPGFETTFEVGMPKHAMVEIGLRGTEIERCIKKSNRSDAVRSTVLLFAEAIRAHLRNEERRPDVWLVVVPDVVYRYGRPQVAPPPRDERTQSAILSSKEAKRFFQQGGDLFPDTMRDAETYLFSSNFHHQLKAELLQDAVVLQLVLESTLVDRSLGLASDRRRGLQDEATVAWNFCTTLYFKLDAKPWALADVRAGVCYVGLVFKNDDTPAATGEACCAAQMFLNSGDGLVFRGALGPWYSDKTREYHLSESAAEALMTSVVDGYRLKHGKPPSQLFIHGRHRFSEAEWAGFAAAVPSETELVGVRIKQQDDVRLFRPSASTPVLRGTALVVDRRNGFLWARGYVPRLAAYQGFETPKPLTIEITHGDGDITQVLTDVLGLTKVNYNACDFSSALPVTLKFADRVGEILMASPRTVTAPPLPFRHYI